MYHHKNSQGADNGWVAVVGFQKKLVLLHFMEMLNFILILLGSPQLDTSPLEIPHDQSPQGAGVDLDTRNSQTARLPAGVSPNHCVSEVKHFFP